MSGSDAELRGPFDWSREQFHRFVSSNAREGNTIRGRKVILLSTVDPATKRIRRSPLMQVKHGVEYAAIGSHGGSPEHPSWYDDILANPVVTVQDGPLRAVYRAHEATGRQREIWWLVGASVLLSFVALAGFEALSRRQRRLIRRDGHR